MNYKRDEEIALYSEVLRRIDAAPEKAKRTLIAHAMFHKVKLSRPELAEFAESLFWRARGNTAFIDLMRSLDKND